MGAPTSLAPALAAVLLLAASLPAAGQSAIDANEAGAALFRAGRHAEAAERFREALERDPGLEAARRNLAAALGTLGQAELTRGRLEEAQGLLERAAELDADAPSYHLLLAVVLARRGDLYDARQRAERALSADPGLAAARELLGDIAYQEGLLARALTEWEAALQAGGAPDHALRAKIERARREDELERGFDRDVSRHFTIQHDGPVPREVARAALRLLEEAYDRLWREFGRAPEHDIPVLLYTRGLFTEVTRSPSWVGGTYDGKIRIPVGGIATADEARALGPVLAHELTHAFVRANVAGPLPRWFEEGLAEHFEGTDATTARQVIRLRGGPFDSLAEVSSALGGGPRVEAAYAAAALAVAELVRMDGFWLPRRVLERMGSGLDFEEAFREAAGLDLGRFQERWRHAQR